MLIPVDFTEVSEDGIKTAVLASKKVTGSIHLVHIINRPLPGGLAQDADLMASQQQLAENELVLEQLIKKKLKDLDKLVEFYEFDKKDVHTHVLVGDFDIQMEKFTDDHSIDLVIMGTEGENTLTELFTGSHAERTIRHTDIPVLAVRKYDPSMRFDKLLMAIDIRDHDETAVRRIKKFTESLDMELILVHVKKKKDAIEENIEATLTRFAEKYNLSQYTIEIAADGKVAKKLEELSEKHQVDMIATFTDADSGLIRLFFGSKTRDLLKHTDVPLLSVHDH
jgi:nucleotide-binding universal stress UspA family protein